MIKYRCKNLYKHNIGGRTGEEQDLSFGDFGSGWTTLKRAKKNVNKNFRRKMKRLIYSNPEEF